MKNKLISVVIAALIIISTLPITVVADDQTRLKGSGSQTSPYEISTAEQLLEFADIVNGTNNKNKNSGAWAVLLNDIVLNNGSFNKDGVWSENGTPIKWTPIGNLNSKYTGTFDGQGYSISGLYCNNKNESFIGLFGLSCGTIKNVTVIDSYITGYRFIGGVCGSTDNNCIIANCNNTGFVSGNKDVGGICGSNLYNSTIENCSNTGIVSGTNYDENSKNVGGICGSNLGAIAKCYNAGEVNQFFCVGGICGSNESINATIKKCYNSGNINGTDTVGGICGNSNGFEISDCYNNGNVNGLNIAGGICGLGDSGSIISCYNIGNITGKSDVGSVCGFNCATIRNCYYNKDYCSLSGEKSSEAIGSAKGLSADQMTGNNAKNNLKGFNFTDTWFIDESKDEKLYYPQLKVFEDQEPPHEKVIYAINLDTSAINLDFGNNVDNNTSPTAKTIIVKDKENNNISGYTVQSNKTQSAFNVSYGLTTSKTNKDENSFTIQPKTDNKAGSYNETFTITTENGYKADFTVTYTVTHEWEDTLSYSDETGHYYKCKHCDEINNKTVHSMSDWELENNTTHKRTCSCGYTETQNHTGAADCCHSAICTICGSEFGDKNPSVHINLVNIPAKAATYQSQGNTEYWYCEYCNKYFSDSQATTEINISDTVIDMLIVPKHTDSPEIPLTNKANDINFSALLFALISSGAVITFKTKRRKTH